MTSLTDLARGLWPREDRPWNPAASTDADLSHFLERLTFADADEIVAMLEDQSPQLADGLMSVWARNLAHRLACLQRPDDPAVLRAAAMNLILHGPDWDDEAEALKARAEALEGDETEGGTEGGTEGDETEGGTEIRSSSTSVRR